VIRLDISPVRLRQAANVRSRLRGELGISLVELLVSMMIFAIILTLVGSMYASMARTVALGNSSNQSTKVAATTMNEVSRVIRFAAANPVLGQPQSDPAISTFSAEALTMYSYVDADATTPKPIQISFTVDASRRLVESRYAATPAAGFWIFATPTPYSTRILAGGIGTPTGAELPLFSYEYQMVNGVQTIVAVQVNLKVTADGNSVGQPVTLQNTVGMPNLGLPRSGQ